MPPRQGGSGIFGATTRAAQPRVRPATPWCGGGLEAVICALALQHGLLPAGINTVNLTRDTLNYLLANRTQTVVRVMSNSLALRHQLQPDIRARH